MGSSQISGFAPNIGVSCNSQFFQLWDGAKPATVEIFGMIPPTSIQFQQSLMVRGANDPYS